MTTGRRIFALWATVWETLLRDLKMLAAQQPDNARAKHWLERCQNAVGHPDRADVVNGCKFAAHVLEK